MHLVCYCQLMSAHTGPSHHFTHLTWADIATIRAAFSSPHPPSVRSVARAYRIDPHTLRDIIHLRTWRPVVAPTTPTTKEQP